LAAKSSHVGVDVDGLDCCLHWPMNLAVRQGYRAS
jgi:hypothetical protein